MHPDEVPTDSTQQPAWHVSLDDLPLVLTIPEVAKVMRISRASAYKQARLWRVTGGAMGLPCVAFGGRVLVRRSDLARLLGVPWAA